MYCTKAWEQYCIKSKMASLGSEKLRRNITVMQVKWAIKFLSYLDYPLTFTVYSDNNLLTYMLRSCFWLDPKAETDRN